MSSWTPSDALVLDARRALAHAPRDTADDRFEAWAWRALLDEDGPALLTRDAAPSHLTASAIVFSPDLRRTCLVLHGKVRAWVQPGGHLEPDDTSMQAAAVREVLEETGLAVDLHPDPAQLSRHRAPCRPGVVDWHLDVQFAGTTDRLDLQVSAESLDLAWFDVDRLPENLGVGTAGTIAKGLARLQVGGGAAADQPSR